MFCVAKSEAMASTVTGDLSQLMRWRCLAKNRCVVRSAIRDAYGVLSTHVCVVSGESPSQTKSFNLSVGAPQVGSSLTLRLGRLHRLVPKLSTRAVLQQRQRPGGLQRPGYKPKGLTSSLRLRHMRHSLSVGYITVVPDSESPT